MAFHIPLLYHSKKQKMKNIASLFVLFIFIFNACVSPPKASNKEQSFNTLCNSIDTYAETTLKSGSINSLALAIYKNGKVYQNYYGEIDKGKNNSPNNQTLYEIASISKVFIGSLTARAVVENKITLKDDIRMYLDGRCSNLEFEGRPIQIKDLLSHTLGFAIKTPPILDSLNKIANHSEDETQSFDYSTDDFLTELESMKLDKEPGTFYEYNSVGPELMCLILEKIYAQDYKEILTSFFEELEMNDTYLQDYEKHKNRIINGYSDNKLTPIDKNPLKGGAYGILAPLPDLVKFMQFQLENKDPLIKESTRQLFEDQEEDEMLGYLWDLGTAEEEGFYYQKSGTSNGVQSIILICPDTNYGQILIMNNVSDDAMRDWGNLYNKMEMDLIKYPKQNLVQKIKEELVTNPQQGIKRYKELVQVKEKYYINPNELNILGYELLKEEKNKKAITIFKLNTQEFPDNWNVYDSLAEAYERDGNKKDAIVNYRQALKLNVNNDYDYNEKLEDKIESLMK